MQIRYNLFSRAFASASCG